MSVSVKEKKESKTCINVSSINKIKRINQSINQSINQ